MHLLHKLQQALHAALQGLVADPASAAALVKPTQDPKHGDYQANCAMALKKELGGKSPREIAETIVGRLNLGDWLEPPEIAGPGFINFRLKNDWLAQQLRSMSGEHLSVEPAGTPRTFVIDYSSPNVAKPMHVGHLRSTIIGDALARLLRNLGHKVIADNHLGDWGTQFGMLIYGWKHFRDNAAFATDPVQELARIYKHVRALTKPADEEELEDEEESAVSRWAPEEVGRAREVIEACRLETAKLHSGDAENLKLWQSFMPACLQELDAIYQRLDVHFDAQHGESFYQPMLADVVADLQAKGIAQESKGAMVIFLAEGQPPAMIRKSDGAFTYTTSDLATIRYRAKEWKPDEVLYVVDFRQTLHFQHLFEIARRWGYSGKFAHISFGSVLDAETGKPIKTREGESTTLEALLNEACVQAREVYESTCQEAQDRGEEVPDLAESEKQEIAQIVGLGAVKYADLSQNRTSDYAFSWEKMLAMNGNTATYMQYAYARNRSIFRKGGVDPAALRRQPPGVQLGRPEERALALQLLRFQDALEAAAAEYKPNLITGYLWDLAKTYSGFFQNCPVLKAETAELRASRLLLCDLTARVIQRGLGLLGIKTLERM
jgi:arginyl-tRNA synthetase